MSALTKGILVIVKVIFRVNLLVLLNPKAAKVPIITAIIVEIKATIKVTLKDCHNAACLNKSA